MQYLYNKVTTLDKRAISKYKLTEDILMENAALGIYNFIIKTFTKNKTILIVCGGGNNGADGITLARLLHGEYKVKICLLKKPKSYIGKRQLHRAKAVGIQIINKISKSNIIIDCLFGTGLNRTLDDDSNKIINKMNKQKSYKIACDIPSGINQYGQIQTICFQADTTITMGALKTSLFTDASKNFVGEIKVANLGISRDKYQIKNNICLLDKYDLKLPIRQLQSTHKGNFGHLGVIIGDKKGAGLLTCKAGFSFGCGLITAITTKEIQKISNDIMQDSKIPQNATALCIGMGLGEKINNIYLNNNIAKVVDADMFYKKDILKLLNQKNIVLTPHPKEFCSLLKLSRIDNISINILQNNRFKYLQLFTAKYPKITILLKGANVLIANKNKLYVNNFGNSSLSKGGSGDVLSGLIGSLLAQGYSAINAAISGSLAHTLAALNYKNNNYSLTPSQLIKEIKNL
jgi:hydroxyethylthiazole kinase-like uncharacterized protein yjeF